MKDLINYDYFVFNIWLGELKVELFYIMVYKFWGGIYIIYILSSDIVSVFYEGVCCFIVDCGKCEKKCIWFEIFFVIFKEEDFDYSLCNVNCWDYVKNLVKWLVKGCVEVCGISLVERVRL